MIFKRQVTEIGEQELRGFLRAGGVISLREWMAMDDDTKVAFERAGTAVTAELALALAACLSGGHEEIAAVVDGGEAASEAALARALTKGLRGHGVVR